MSSPARSVSLRRVRLHGAWLARNAGVGAAAGLLLGSITQIGVGLTGAETPAGGSGSVHVWQRLVGVLLTGATFAAVMAVSGGLGGFFLRCRGGRTLAVVGSGATVGVLFVWHAVGLVVRLLAGANVTVGAIDFFMNSAGHLLAAIVTGYLLQCALLLAAALGVSLLAARFVRAAAALPPPLPAVSIAGVAVGVACLASILMLSGAKGSAFERVWRTTPDLALIDSIHDELSEKYSPAPGPPAPGEMRPEDGPPRSAEAIWKAAAEAAAGERPNVLLLVLESVSSRHLGYMGYRRAITPNLDRIAARSRRFRRAWSTATHSNYSQMAVLSSLFPRRGSGLDTYRRLDYPRVLLHDFLHRLGYETATISSQDETWQGMIRFERTDTPTYFFHARDHSGPFVRTGSEEVVPDELTAARAIEWIQRHEDHRWGLYVNFQMTHFPYRLPEGAAPRFADTAVTPGTFSYLGYLKRDTRAVINRYDNALAYVDRQIGRLARYLERSGLLANTLFIVTADHGELFHHHGAVTHGKTLYDAEARVPLLFHWPRRLRPGDVDIPVSTLDVMPTVADLLGVPPHPSFQGRSLADLDELAGDDTAVFLNIQGLRSMDGIVCWPWKLVVDTSDRSTVLYDLSEDPNEDEDLGGVFPGVAYSLARTLRAQMRAQMRYHRTANADERKERFAPRLLECPDLDGARASRSADDPLHGSG